MRAEVEQLDALARAFFARFFESEMTSGTDDLKSLFFWLLAALAVPGMFIPWMMAFQWQLLAFIDGAEAVRLASRAEKTFYLGYAMFASGVLTLIAWSSLLPDHRDTLILGALPVRPRTVVAGKLAGLAGYLGLVAVGMHAPGAVFWGLILGDRVSFPFSLRGIGAHFAASTAASASVCLAFAGAQGIALAIAGPRWFRRVSTVLQIALVALIVFSLAMLPTLNMTVVRTLAGAPGAEPWILSTPPVWFLGIYEWLLGTDDPLLLRLAGRAGLAFSVAAAMTIATFPLAYRRLMISTVESGSEPRNSVARWLHARLVRAAGRRPAPQAAAEFFTATLARVDRQRFVVALSLGLAIAWSMPGLRGYAPSAVPQPALLGLPLAVMMFLLVGLRISSSLPGDVRAAWLFEVHDLARRDARQAVERTLLILGVLPPIAVATPAFAVLWGVPVAVTHALVMAAIGVALIEVLIWRCNAMPCGQPWTPARVDFGRRWPLHLAVFLMVVTVVPRLELLLFRNAAATAVFVAALLVLAAILRRASARHEILPSHDEVDPVAGVLRLN